VLAVLFGGVAAAADPPRFDDVIEQSKGGLREIVERYTQDEASLGRFYDLEISAASLERQEQFYQGWRSGLRQLAFDTLDQQGKVDYLLLENQIDFQLRRIGLLRGRISEMAPLIPFATRIIALHDRLRQRETTVPDQTAAALNDLGNEIEKLQQEFGAQIKPPSDAVSHRAAASPSGPTLPDIRQIGKMAVNRAAGAVDDLRATLKQWFDYHHGYDPLFTWWVGEPYKKLDAALGRYAGFLRQEVVGLKEDDTETVLGDPIGREALLVELRREMIPYTPEELIEIARKELAWCDAEMLRAALSGRPPARDFVSTWRFYD
jgi:hypothetical protein